MAQLVDRMRPDARNEQVEQVLVRVIEVVRPRMTIASFEGRKAMKRAAERPSHMDLIL